MFKFLFSLFFLSGVFFSCESKAGSGHLAVVLCNLNFSALDCVRTPRFNDWKLAHIKSIRTNFQSFNPGSFHISRKYKNLVYRALGPPRTAGGAFISSKAITGTPILEVSLEENDRKALEKYPQTLHKLERGEPLSIEDIKKMSKAGLSDEVIIDQINTTNSAFYLNTTDIIGLKKAKVSQPVIDYMIQSGNR